MPDSRPVNLELLSALTNNKITQVPTTSKHNLDLTLEDATGYWIRHHRGQGWVIASIEITLAFGLVWERSATQFEKRNLGLLAENQDVIQELASAPLLLVTVEVDKLTPAWVAQVTQFMAQQPQSKLLILTREGW